MVDFRDLKQALFDSADARVEKVEVNQRHLIDKILARYNLQLIADSQLALAIRRNSLFTAS